MIFDSHFHLSAMKERNGDISLPSSFLGMEVANGPGDTALRLGLAGNRRDIYLSVGAGPWCTAPDYPLSVRETVKMIERDIGLFGADAIGECGFDFHRGYGRKEDMEELFLAQASIASSMDIPLIIHMRDADEMILRNISAINDRTIMHCFSSGKEMMMKLLDRGACISFAGNVTYRGNTMIQEAASNCPLERLLYETDSPYLTPREKRGEGNRPEYSRFTLSFLSSLRGEDEETIERNAVKNFLSLMKNRESVVRRDLPVGKEGPDD